MKLLLIDRDHEVIAMLTDWLKMRGYDVCQASTVQQARVAWLEHQPDLVLVDPQLKDSEMLTVCQELRQRHDVFLLIMTDENDVRYEIHCLESGADDYLRKPFWPAQLLARLHAVSRRGRSTLHCRPPFVITRGGICVDTRSDEATISGRTVRLSPIESKLLHLLMTHADEVCITEQIVTHLWGYEGDGDERFVKTHIRHLRQKIEPDPSRPHCIVTIAGVGYTFLSRSTCGQTVKRTRDVQEHALQEKEASQACVFHVGRRER